MSGLHQAQPSPGLWAVTVSHPVQAVGKQRLAQSLPPKPHSTGCTGVQVPSPERGRGVLPRLASQTRGPDRHRGDRGVLQSRD